MSRRPDDEEFTAFVQSSSRSLYRTAYLLLGDHAEAEDLVQTSLAKTYAKWGSVRSVDAAGSYAHRVLLNTAASWFRRRSWRNERPTESAARSRPRARSDRSSDLDERPARACRPASEPSWSFATTRT